MECIPSYKSFSLPLRQGESGAQGGSYISLQSMTSLFLIKYSAPE